SHAARTGRRVRPSLRRAVARPGGVRGTGGRRKAGGGSTRHASSSFHLRAQRREEGRTMTRDRREAGGGRREVESGRGRASTSVFRLPPSVSPASPLDLAAFDEDDRSGFSWRLVRRFGPY